MVVVAGLITFGAVGEPSPTRAAFPGDNGRIYFTGGPVTPHVWSIAPDGSDLRPLARAHAEEDWVAASPSGSRIAYERQTNRGTARIETVNARGRNGVVVTRGPQANDYAPAYSGPNGTSIAYVRADHVPPEQTQIWLIRADGQNNRRLTEGHFDADPSSSPNGKSLAFTRARSIANGRRAHPNIYRLRLSDGRVRRLTHTPPSTVDAEPDFSPNGDRIAFTRVQRARGSRISGPRSRIFVMHADGSDPRPITPRRGRCSSPAFAPDGKSLAYICGGVVHPRLVISRPNGTHARTVGGPRLYPEDLSWAPTR
jgi:Tol biopolymer transport system component